MKRLAVLFAAVLLVLVSAAPAAAAKPVVVFKNQDFVAWEDPAPIPPEWGWIDCGCDVFVGQTGGRESLTLYYEDGADPATDVWTKAIYQRQGSDYFRCEDRYVYGKYHLTQHHSDVVLGDPDTHSVMTTGRMWGIQLPSEGPVYHVSGNLQETVLGPFNDSSAWVWVMPSDREKGNFTLDEDTLCEALEG